MKNVLITGVCGGMGYAAAKRFLNAGFRVFGIDRQPSCDLPIDYFPADITNTTSMEEVRGKIASEVDKIDGILHFAGIYNLDSLVEISEESFVKIFDINLFGVYRINKAFVSMMGEGGRIVITSSELAPLDPLPFTGLYAVTKGAVEKYADSLRMELNLHGISVSVLRPGAVRTGMLARRRRRSKNSVKRRSGTPATRRDSVASWTRWRRGTCPPKRLPIPLSKPSRQSARSSLTISIATPCCGF